MNFFKFKKNKAIENAEDPTYAILNKDSRFSVKESYKALRTNIIFSLKDAGSCKVVSMASANPAEGKTTTAVNLAITFAEMSSKVLLIDCDLRKPKVHKYANVKNKVGLSNILCGFAKVEEAITHTEYGFDCILSGHIPPNPSELLASKEMDSLVCELKKSYDFIFLDCPPINIVTDALSVATHCDGTIFIVKPNSTTKSDLTSAIGKYKFTELNVIGFIVNATDGKQGSYYKNAKYSNKNVYYNYYNYAYKNSTNNLKKNTNNQNNK